MQNEWDKLGPVQFDKNDLDFANKIRSTFTETEILDSFQRIGIKAPLDLPLCDFVAPLEVPIMVVLVQLMWVMLAGLFQQSRLV